MHVIEIKMVVRKHYSVGMSLFYFEADKCFHSY
jgi:hypothetical protein